MVSTKPFSTSGLTMASALVVVLLAGTSAPAVELPKAQQQCINELNKGLAKIAKTQGKKLGKCLKGHAKGTLVTTLADCTTGDPDGKLAKITAKSEDKAATRCVAPLPPFAATAADTVALAATEMPRVLLNEVYGADLDTAIVAASGATKADSKCQLAVAKQAGKCMDASFKEFAKCKKSALAGKNGPPTEMRADLQSRCLTDPSGGGIPDAKGKIDKACGGGMAKTLGAKCGGVDLATALPGDCAAAGDPAACLAALAACRVCRAANLADAFQRDCDLLDDGAANTSCVPECGDGLLEFPEQCDDGATIGGDGCSPSCQSELPFTISLVDFNILQNISSGNIGFDDIDDRLTLLSDRLAIAQPDLVTLQEVVLGGAGGTAFLLDDLATRYGLTYFGVEYGFASGNALLSRWPATLHEVMRLPSVETVPSFPDRRFAARVEVDSPVGPLDVYPMHFCAGSIGCTMDDRVVQTEAFIDFVHSTHRSAHPAIIGADFNAHTGAGPDGDPTNDPPIDLMQAEGWVSLFDGFDAPCDPPADRSGCTSDIDDLTMPNDTTTRRIDNLMVVAASEDGPIPPISQATEVGPTERFGDMAFVDPNPECRFDPRIACASDANCPAGAECNVNDFCVRTAPIVCSTNADCPGDLAPEVCLLPLWISDHVGVTSAIELDALP